MPELEKSTGVSGDQELSDHSPNDTTFLVEVPEEEVDTGRSVASLSMLQSTIDDHLACIRDLAGDRPPGCDHGATARWTAAGEGCSSAEGRSSPPLPSAWPDLGLVLADLGLELEGLEPQVRGSRRCRR